MMVSCRARNLVGSFAADAVLFADDLLHSFIHGCDSSFLQQTNNKAPDWSRLNLVQSHDFSV
jgi:hypothetical protein